MALDIGKAFDTFCHEMVERAFRRKGVDSQTIEYIMAIYKDAFTTISCIGEEICTLLIKRRMKQGDPMSTLLFNIVMDELLEHLEPESGIKGGDQPWEEQSDGDYSRTQQANSTCVENPSGSWL